MSDMSEAPDQTKSVATTEPEPEPRQIPKIGPQPKVPTLAERQAPRPPSIVINRGARLHVGKIKAVNHARNTWFANIPAGTVFETLLEPDYWAHHTREIRPLDLIEAFCEDGAWEALLRVMFVGRAEIKLSQVYFVQHQEPGEETDSEDYQVFWRGPALKFGVRNRHNGEVVKDGFYPKSEAHKFLREHLKTVRR